MRDAEAAQERAADALAYSHAAAHRCKPAGSRPMNFTVEATKPAKASMPASFAGPVSTKSPKLFPGPHFEQASELLAEV